MEYINLEFDSACSQKWEDGKRNHRSDPDQAFTDDPVVELFNEMIDAYNYTIEADNEGIELPVPTDALRTTFKNIALMLQEQRRKLKRRIP